MKKTTRKRILSVLLASVLLLTLIFAGCGNNKTTDDQTGDGNGTQAEYAVILKTLSNDFWATMKTGIEEEAKKLGVTVDVFAANSEEDTEGQLRILENCVAKGYKAIGVAPLSPTNLINGIVAANQKGHLCDEYR